MIYIGRKILHMKIIDGYVFYEEHDICKMLYLLENITGVLRCRIIEHIINGGYGVDTAALVNIISDPFEYNIDYLYCLDQDVTEEFIAIMESFGIA